jgi:hypothetical protein
MLSRTKQCSAYCGRHCALYVPPLESPQYLSINSHHLRLAPVIVISSMFFSLSIYCNRHNRRANLATAQQTQRGSRATYGRNPHDPGSAGGLAPPQYPPPAHNPFDDPYIYDPTTGFAPVREVSVSSLQLFLLIPPTPPLSLVAFRPAATVLSASAWRAPDHIRPEECRMMVLRDVKYDFNIFSLRVSFGKCSMLFFFYFRT